MLSRYPTLQRLHEELSGLAAEEAVGLRTGRVRYGPGRDLVEVTIPWLGKRYLCTVAQREVVRQLVHAQAHCASPDVDEQTLLGRAGVRGPLARSGGGRGPHKLAALFAGHPAWGELILPGDRPATYRICPPPEEETEEARVESEG